MGYEYHVHLNEPVYAVIDKALRQCPYFDRYHQPYDTYHFQWGASESDQMPNAFVAIRPYGLYVCLNSGPENSLEFIEHLRALVVNEFNQPFDMIEA